MKNFFPASYLAKNVLGLIFSIIIYALVFALFGWLASLIKGWFVIGLIEPALWAIGGGYAAIGIIIALVIFIKDREK